MHPAFQQQKPSSNDCLNREMGENGKTYTELKLYKDDGHANSLQAHLNGMRNCGLEADVSDEGSEGSESEEIDLTSSAGGTCLDYSNNKAPTVLGTTSVGGRV